MEWWQWVLLVSVCYSVGMAVARGLFEYLDVWSNGDDRWGMTVIWPIALLLLPTILVERWVQRRREARLQREREEQALLAAAERELKLDELRAVPIEDRWEAASKARDAKEIGWREFNEIVDEDVRRAYLGRRH